MNDKTKDTDKQKPTTRSQAKTNEELRREIEELNRLSYLGGDKIARSPVGPKTLPRNTFSNESLELAAEGSSGDPPTEPTYESNVETKEVPVGNLIAINDSKSDSSSTEGVAADDSQITSKFRQSDRKMSKTTQTIKVRDAIQYVPQFDGHNVPISEFLRACKEAKGMVDDASEEALVKLIGTKIIGEAKRTMLTKTFKTVAELTSHFKDLYDSGETLQQLLGKLGYEVQRENEGVIPFANRLREIGSRIFEARAGADGKVPEDAKKEIENCIMDSFRRGLRPEIDARLPANVTPEEVMKEAVKVERQLKNRENLLATVTRNDARRKAVLATQNQGENRNNNLTCGFCRKPGHAEEHCFAKAKAAQTKACQLCNGIGHVATGCHKFIKCQLCDKPGHKANECYQYKGAKSSEINQQKPQCQVCKKFGHKASNCFQVNPDLAALECSFCKRKGHSIENCRTRRNLLNNASGNAKSLPVKSADKETPLTRSLNATEFDNLLCELLPLD